MPHPTPSPNLPRGIAFGVCAYDEERAFDTERLPYRLVDRMTRPWGLGMIVGAILVAVVLAIVILDTNYGDPASGAPDDPRIFEYILGTLAVFLAATGTWLWPRRNILEITSGHVRVKECRLFGGETWVEPLSEYHLVLHSRFEPNAEGDWGDDSHSWSIYLVHEHASRSVLLRSRTLLVSEGYLEEFDGRFSDESKASVTEGFLEVSKRWARALNVPLWKKEGSEEARQIVGETMPDEGDE